MGTELPVVSAPLRSLHNRSPPDFLQHIPTYSKPTRHKVFLRNYWNPRKLTANIYCKSTIIPLCLLWICSSNMKSFSDNSFSIICGKELHFLLDLTLSHEKPRYTCNSFCQILRKALLLEEIARIFLQNMQRFFTFKPIYVALRPSNTLVLQDLLSSCLCHAS